MKLSQIILMGCLTLTLSCHRAPIPLDTLTIIIAEMLTVEQRIQEVPNLSSMADTSLVYLALLQKYGYSTNDLLYSMNRFAREPEKLKKALRHQLDLMNAQKKAMERQLDKQRKKIDSNQKEWFASLFEHSSDSLFWWLDLHAPYTTDSLPLFRLYPPLELDSSLSTIPLQDTFRKSRIVSRSLLNN